MYITQNNNMNGFLAFLITEASAKYIVLIALILAIGKKTKQILEYMGIDLIAPEIILKGDETMQHERGGTFVDPGAVSPDPTATVETSGTVDSDQVGTYEIAYVATDKSGNRSETIKRSVTVEDTTAPVVSLLGSKVMHVLQDDDTYVDPGVTVDDDTAVLETTGSVDVNVPGTYTLTYSATDPYGNVSESVSRTVEVVMKIPSYVPYYAAAVVVVIVAAMVLRRTRRSDASVVDVI